MIQNIFCKEIEFNSSEQKESVNLRYHVLRKPLNMQFDEADLAKEYHDFHLAAFLDHQIIGILLLKPMDKTLIKMRQVAVDSNFQGKGVGKKLVDFAETFCLAKGYNKIELHARDTAIPFYQTLNYEIEGETFLEVGIPHKKMFKAL